MTLYEYILQNKNKSPNTDAIRYFNYTESHKQMLDSVDFVASSLRKYGIKKGDKVAICLPNQPEMLHIFYAINKIGAVAVMINPKSPSPELYRQIHMTGCVMVFFSQISIRNVTGMQNMPGAKTIRYICVPILRSLPFAIDTIVRFKMLKASDNRKYREAYGINAIQYKNFLVGKDYYDGYETDDKADAVVIFSGGTGGAIKAVVHSSYAFNYSAESCLETERPWPDEVAMLAILPSFHIFGLTVALHLPYIACGCAVLVPFFNLKIITDVIKKGCPSFFPGVPTMFERLLEYPGFVKAAQRGKLDFSRFRHGFVGGDFLDNDVRDRFNALLKKLGSSGYISMGYGMSECCPICVNNRESGYDRSVGIPFNGMRIRIRSEETGEYLPEGKMGEIVISSPYMMLRGIDENGNEYMPFQDDNGVKWYRTGDMGMMKEGIIYYECRARRIIKVSGNTIFASSIEKVLQDNIPYAEAVYVVPVPHESRGQGAYAFVVCDSRSRDMHIYSLVKNICRENLIPYAIPVGASVITKDEVPHTAIGKVAWGQLEKMAIERYR